MAKRGHNHIATDSPYRRCGVESCKHEAKHHVAGKCRIADCPDHLWQEPAIVRLIPKAPTWVEAPLFDIDNL